MSTNCGPYVVFVKSENIYSGERDKIEEGDGLLLYCHDVELASKVV